MLPLFALKSKHSQKKTFMHWCISKVPRNEPATCWPGILGYFAIICQKKYVLGTDGCRAAKPKVKNFVFFVKRYVYDACSKQRVIQLFGSTQNLKIDILKHATSRVWHQKCPKQHMKNPHAETHSNSTHSTPTKEKHSQQQNEHQTTQ